MAGKAGSATKKKVVQKIKKDLQEKKRAILAGANDAINAKLGAQSENLPELGDQAAVEIDSNFLLRLKGRERRLLAKIGEALERIEKGTYGLCESCGEQIGLKRLEARPVTSMCIECKTEEEERERIMAKD
jgi:DnaK suppressor protein